MSPVTVALVSVKGSPGLTTFACLTGALRAEGSVVVAECDPAGADLAPRFGLATGIGMASIVMALRQGPVGAEELTRHLQVLPGGLEVLAGPAGMGASAALDRELATVSLVTGISRDVLLDCGRIAPASEGQRRLVREADRVVLVARPDASSLAHSRWAVEHLAAERSQDRSTAGLVVIGDGPYEAPELAGVLGIPLIGTVPWDPAAAALACGQAGTRRSLERSSLVRAVSRVVPSLFAPVRREELRDAS